MAVSLYRQIPLWIMYKMQEYTSGYNKNLLHLPRLGHYPIQHIITL